MKSLAFIILFVTLNIGAAIGQSLPSGSNKSIIFLCPPCGIDCDTIHFEKPGFCPVCGMKLFASYSEYENREGEHGDYCHKKVAVVLFPGVEIIDFAGPWEVFGAAGMDVYSVAASDSILSAGMGLKIKPNYTFATAPTPDIILVPGGNVNPSDTVVVNWIVETSRKSAHTMSVCTGAFYLAAGGLLDNLKATTNYPAIEVLKQVAPKATVIDKVRFVDNGRIITSAGLSSGIDAAFHLVSLYVGKAQTKKLANILEYDWRDKDPFVRSKLADKHVQDFFDALIPFDYEMTEYAGGENDWHTSVKLKTNLDQADLLSILFTQFEQVSRWQKTKKSTRWRFDDKGEKWSAALSHIRHGDDEFTFILKVSKK